MSVVLVNAQITLTQSNNAPVPGDIVLMNNLDSSATLDKSSGAGITWDYTGSVMAPTNSYTAVSTYTTPSSIPGASIFTSAGSNVALADSGGFYKSTSTSLEMLGFIDNDGSVFFLSNSGKVMQYPFSYGNSYTDNATGTYTVTSMGVFNISGDLSATADAWGTVILPSSPNLVFNNVLRVKETRTLYIAGTGTLSMITGTTITTEYMYFKTGTKNEFFKITYEHINIPMFGPPSMDYYIEYDATLVLNAQAFLDNKLPVIFLYPNPTKDVLNIQMSKIDYTKIQIIDIQGKMVKEFIINNQDVQSIDIQDLRSGEYILLMTNSQSGLSDVSYKFIKE